MDLTAAITSDDLPALLREHPELVAATDEHGVSALLLTLYHRRRTRATRCWRRVRRSARSRRRRSATSTRSHGADLSVRGGDGFTPLHLAAFFGGAEAVRAILATGADPDADAENTFKVRPIHSAVAVGDHASVRALLEAGANPNVAAAGRLHAAARAAHSTTRRTAAEMREALLRATRRMAGARLSP